MSFTKELGSNLHMINDITGHSDKTIIANHVTNMLDHIDHSDDIFNTLQLHGNAIAESGAKSQVAQKVQTLSIQPTLPDKGITRAAAIVNDTTIPHVQQPQTPVEVIQPSTQLTTIPKKKVSFQSEVHVVEPPQSHIAPHVQEPTQQNISQNLTNINNIVGFKMSISTLYFVGLLIIIGAVAYFQQKRK